MNTMKKHTLLRLLFSGAALLLLVAEVLIALFVRDAFVRPYLGDVLVVILLYCIVRCGKPTDWPLLPLGLFLFAAAVEAAQAMHLVTWLGWEDVPLLATLLGTSFSWWDMLCYAVGSVVCAGMDAFVRRWCI